MNQRLYLRKAWAGPCIYCGKPGGAYQVTAKDPLSGSRLWAPGLHAACVVAAICQRARAFFNQLPTVAEEPWVPMTKATHYVEEFVMPLTFDKAR